MLEKFLKSNKTEKSTTSTTIEPMIKNDSNYINDGYYSGHIDFYHECCHPDIEEYSPESLGF